MARLWLSLTWVLCTLAAVLTIGPAAAWADDDDEEEPEYARPGGYVRGSAELALTTSRQGFLPGDTLSWQPNFGMDVALGWRNSERLALEAELEWITNRDGIEYSSILLGVNGKFYFLEERIQPYLVLGASGMWTQVPNALEFQDDWAFRNGLGVDYYLDEHWAINAETTFVWGVGDIWRNYYMTFGLGMMYRF
jgi:hypothetical protein